MQVYIAHSKQINYTEELYIPLRQCEKLNDIIIKIVDDNK